MAFLTNPRLTGEATQRSLTVVPHLVPREDERGVPHKPPGPRQAQFKPLLTLASRLSRILRMRSVTSWTAFSAPPFDCGLYAAEFR